MTPPRLAGSRTLPTIASRHLRQTVSTAGSACTMRHTTRSAPPSGTRRTWSTTISWPRAPAAPIQTRTTTASSRTTDNCPGIWNPDQANEEGPLGDLVGDLVTNPGDACDSDIDGDGQINTTFASLQSKGAKSPSTLDAPASQDEVVIDPFPFDTDNDGSDNDVDADDDNDGVPDASDRCRLAIDPAQLDRDGDGVGDRCDLDADNDGRVNTLEEITGSNPLSASSAPEYVGVGSGCTNGLDDDGDGAIDGADASCHDADTDGIADAQDNCPAIPNRGQGNADQDAAGDACDLVASIDWVRFSSLPAINDGTEFYWSATRAGTFSVRSGGSDCRQGPSSTPVHMTRASSIRRPEDSRPRRWRSSTARP